MRYLEKLLTEYYKYFTHARLMCVDTLDKPLELLFEVSLERSRVPRE